MTCPGVRIEYLKGYYETYMPYFRFRSCQEGATAGKREAKSFISCSGMRLRSTLFQ